ncbi:MAG TPA: c-type cytochrome biogenesis protein CcsB [Gaiellaceae bacterium]|nr:c-type cytochrome biogenesis protein CcsB [Gaiellaceae bacterium]
MDKMSQYMLVAALIALGLASVFYIWDLFGRRQVVTARLATSAGPALESGTAAAASGGGAAGRYGTLLAANALAFLTGWMIFRTLSTGHGPFSNMHEFAAAFSWGIVAAYLSMEVRTRTRALGAIVVPTALAVLWYASTLPADAAPLVPALQNNLLLTAHVAVSIVAYGTFAVSFGAAVLYLLQERVPAGILPDAGLLDEIGYRSVTIGFPFMALVIILGALWANVAWGRYWGWDPKETASLVTWLIYGAYLHARTLRGWKGDRSAALLVVGFGAVLFTYFGNLFFGGLHSYAGLR